MDLKMMLGDSKCVARKSIGCGGTFAGCRNTSMSEPGQARTGKGFRMKLVAQANYFRLN